MNLDFEIPRVDIIFHFSNDCLQSLFAINRILGMKIVFPFAMLCSRPRTDLGWICEVDDIS